MNILNAKNWQRLVEALFCFWIFLLPWQTRWIIELGTLHNTPSEFQTLSIYGTQLLLLVCWTLLPFLFMHEGGPNLPPRSPLSLLLALLLVAFISVYWSVDPRLSLFRFLALLLGASSTFLIVLLRPKLTPITLAFFLSAIIQSLLASVQFFELSIPANSWLGLAFHSASTLGDAAVESDSGRFLRGYGSFPHPNLFGGFLAITAFAGSHLWFKAKHSFERCAILVGSGIIGMGLILSFSRGAWLAFILTVFILVSFGIRQQNIREAIKPLGPIGMMIIVGTIIAVLLSPIILPRLQAQGRIERISTSSRSEQREDAWKLGRKFFLQGTGLGAFTTALNQLEPKRSGFSMQPVHVVPLLAFVELGFFGGTIFLFLIGWLMRSVWRELQSSIHRSNVLTVSGMLLTAIFLLFTDHYLWTFWSGQAFFWTIIGLSLLTSPHQS